MSRESSKERRRKALITTALTAVGMAAAGFVYYLIVSATGKGIPCFLYSVTGMQCPTCGITRMFVHLFQGDISSAFKDNQFMFFVWPYSVGEILYVIYKGVLQEEISKKNFIFLYIIVGFAVVFCIIRNTGLI